MLVLLGILEQSSNTNPDASGNVSGYFAGALVIMLVVVLIVAVYRGYLYFFGSRTNTHSPTNSAGSSRAERDRGESESQNKDHVRRDTPEAGVNDVELASVADKEGSGDAAS